MFMTKMSKPGGKHMYGAALVIALASAPAWAQDGLRSASLPEVSLLPPNPYAPVDLYRAGPRTYAPPPQRLPRDLRRPRLSRLPRASKASRVGDFGFFPFDSLAGPWAPYGFPVENPGGEEVGYLLPQVTPGTAEVVIDGEYLGTVDELRRTGVGQELQPGPHRLELRAPGYEPVTAGVRIAADETLFYRRDLESTPRPAPAPPPPGVPKTFYVIPGCYAGDRPPQAERLPSNCNAANVRTIPPQISSVRVSK
jgi:PEGA domain